MCWESRVFKPEVAWCYLFTINHFVCLSPPLPSTFYPYRKVQLPGNQHCRTEQWPGWWWHIHWLYYERRGRGSRWPNWTRRHASAGWSMSKHTCWGLVHWWLSSDIPPDNGLRDQLTAFIHPQRNVAQRLLSLNSSFFVNSEMQHFCSCSEEWEQL